EERSRIPPLTDQPTSGLRDFGYLKWGSFDVVLHTDFVNFVNKVNYGKKLLKKWIKTWFEHGSWNRREKIKVNSGCPICVPEVRRARGSFIGNSRTPSGTVSLSATELPKVPKPWYQVNKLMQTSSTFQKSMAS
ncbi:hypothetical protein J4Q44_G00099570, partial [Coregonus suidteri]